MNSEQWYTAQVWILLWILGKSGDYGYLAVHKAILVPGTVRDQHRAVTGKMLDAYIFDMIRSLYASSHIKGEKNKRDYTLTYTNQI